MFYIKKKFDDGSEIQVPLDDFDFYGTNMFCEDCSKIYRAIKE